MNPRCYYPLLSIMYLLLSVTSAPAQNRSLDATEKTKVIDKVGELLKVNYVFPEKAEEAARYLQSQLAGGAYSNVSDLQFFAEELTSDLRNFTHDLHVRVFVTLPHNGSVNEDTSAEMARMNAQMARDNFGFARTESLPGNVGYLVLNEFAPAELGGATANAAMSFLANSAAVIIDLRRNGGGSPDMIQLISSYFFTAPTHLNDLYWRKEDRTDQFWTLPYIPGKKMPDVPLYILTSSRTFSGAEEFSNNMKVLKRAKIIGETTGGGANPGGIFDVSPELRMFVPTGRAVNPITHTNWEGTGVEPDEKVPSADAFNVAYREALQSIETNANDADQKVEARWAEIFVKAQMNPVKLTSESIARMAGTYQTRRIRVQDGQLYLDRDGRPPARLLALSADIFAIEGEDEPRLRFVEDSSRGITNLVEFYRNGRQEQIPKE